MKFIDAIKKLETGVFIYRKRKDCDDHNLYFFIKLPKEHKVLCMISQEELEDADEDWEPDFTFDPRLSLNEVLSDKWEVFE